MSDFKAKMHHFGWGSVPHSIWRAYSSPLDSLAGFKGPPSREGDGIRNLLSASVTYLRKQRL